MSKKNKEDHTRDVLAAFIEDYKEDVYYGNEKIDYKTSMGSLELNDETGGGLPPGIHRFCGITEGGKTSESLECMGNFLAKKGKRKGLYIKAEGRLSDQVQERCQFEFVEDANKWEDGTCFVLKCNIYEPVCDLVERLVKRNPDGYIYFIIIDSMDGLMLKEDSMKPFDVATRVAGVPYLTSNFLKRMSLPIGEFGHTVILISQVRSTPRIDPYSKGEYRHTTATGGNAIQHFANWVFEFQERYNKDLILEKPTERPDREKNKILGHWVKVIIKKSSNEKTNVQLRYPIKYGRKDGKSIWIEYELIDVFLKNGWLTRKGSWLSFEESMLEMINQNGFNMKANFAQGLDNARKYLEDNPKLTEYLYSLYWEAAHA